MEAGLDEAGRGPVVGPLVVGLVASEDPPRLAALGVKDSKLLTRKRREELDAEIRDAADKVASIAVPAAELDARMRRMNLNHVEVAVFADLARPVEADAFFLDACDVDAARFGRRFLAALARPRPWPRIVSEHRADATYPLVAAASIVAKVQRDRSIDEIAKRLEPGVGVPLGSGYSHDVVTRRFLERHLELFGRLPDEARALWATSRGLVAARSQQRLPG